MPPAIRPYAVALLANATAIALTTLLWSVVESSPVLFFRSAVVVTAWYGNQLAGLVATILAVAVLDFAFLPPVLQLRAGLQDGLLLAVFVAIALLISSGAAAAARRGRPAAGERGPRPAVTEAQRAREAAD